MLRLKKFELRQEEAGGANGGGQQAAAGAGNQQAAGGGSGDPLFGDGGNAGGSGQGGAGNNNAAAGQAAAGNAGAGGNAGGQANPAVKIPENWQDGLSAEIKALPQASKYKTVDELVRAHAHLEKTLGSERIAVPQKGTPLEQMKEVFEKLGVPKELKDYAVELEKTTEVDPDFFNAFKAQAHASGMLPQQTKAMAEWFAKVNKEAFDTHTMQVQSQAAKELNDYKTQLGDNWNETLAQAKAALKEFTTPEEAKYFREMGLGNNPKFLALLAKAGAGLGEGKIRGEGGSGTNGYTPQQAQQKIQEINKTPSHPYWDKNHAGHEAAKKEMQTLYRFAHPDTTPIKPTNENTGQNQGGGRSTGGSFNFNL